MSQENIAYLYNVFENVFVFLERNGYTVAEKISKEVFYNDITYKKIKISAMKNSINTIIVIFMDNDPAIKTSNDMEKLINSIDKESNIILITPDDVSTGVQKKIDSLQSERKDTILVYHNKKFAMIFPDRERAAKHRVLSKTEAEKVLVYDLMANASNIGNIIVTGSRADVQAVWIEARRGDIIHIREKNETAGFIDSYRRAI
jgi:DNA-directed RNA polymerase subunit H (RpoH/RPB5)